MTDSQQNSIGVSVVRDYERLKKVRAPKRPKRKHSKLVADRQYNVVQIAKAAATAAGTAEKPTAAEASSAGEVQNRAGKVEVTEKRKAEELEGGMEFDQSAAAEEPVEDSEAARAAKQQRI